MHEAILPEDWLFGNRWRYHYGMIFSRSLRRAEKREWIERKN